MKKIPNELVFIHISGPNIYYKDLLKTCLDYSPQGFTLQLIRERKRVDEAMDRTGDDYIELEDADYITAQNAIKTVVWQQRNPAYIQFALAFDV